MSTRGRALVAQIDELAVPPGMLAMWALGQSGFILKGGQTVAYLDPYLTNAVDEAGYAPQGSFPRLFPPPLAPAEATNAQVVFCSHEHVDHTDPQTVAPLSRASPRSLIVCSSWSRDMLLASAVPSDRILVPRLDEARSLAGLTFTAVPAAHYGVESDPERGHRWLGYVIELNGVTLYHAGDTILHEGLVDRLKKKAVDVACLPVNGRDFWREQRGIIGNLDARESAELAATIGADVLIPMHNDMFALNHANPAVLADFLDRHYPRQRYHWLQPGELYLYVKGPRGSTDPP
jgi:L-ascorbate metabolism protein UlaG (beta-lactamase superfamily)